MLLIQKSIFREQLQSFIISILGLNLILMMEKILKLSRVLAGLGATFSDFLEVILLVQPQLMLFTLPMSFLLSVLLTYGRMVMDNEVIVLRSAGMPLHSLFKPTFYISGILLAISFLVSLYIMPKALTTLRGHINTLLQQRAAMAIEPGIFFNAFKGIVILTNEKDPSGTYKGIFLYDERDKEQRLAIYAQKGNLVIDKDMVTYLKLNNGTVHIVKNEGSVLIKFKEYTFKVSVEGELLGQRKNEMTLQELFRKAKEEEFRRLDYFIEIHRRFSFPLLIIILAFLAPPLSLMAGKSGRLGGLFLGLALFTLYYAVLLYSENLVRTGKAPHYVCWIPFVILAIISAVLYWRANE